MGAALYLEPRHHVVQRHGPRDTQGKRDEAEHDADVSSSGTGSSPRPCMAAHPCVTIRAQILDQFGPRVLAIVDAMTDAAPEAGEKKPPWREGQEAYVAHLAGCDYAGMHRVCLSDNLQRSSAPHHAGGTVKSSMPVMIIVVEPSATRYTHTC